MSDLYTTHTTHTGPATPEAVWDVLVDYAAYPGFMAGVREVTITEDGGETRESSWVVELKGSEMEWEQADTIDAANRRVGFRQTDGDLAHYEGYWQVTEHADGAALELRVAFDVGLPLVAEMIHPAVAEVLEGYQKSIIERAARA